MTDLSPGALSGRARGLYAEGPWLSRTLQGYRPLICPFGELIEAVPEGASVLDVGCGGGLFLGLLAESGRISKGHGFDASAPAIALASHMRDRHPAKEVLTFERRSAQGDWPEGEYDVVSLIDVIHHVPRDSQAATLARAAEKVRPGGILLYKDVSRRPHWMAWASRLHDLVIARQWIHIPDFSRVAAAIHEQGFEQTTFAHINMFWYGHELAVFRRVDDAAKESPA